MTVAQAFELAVQHHQAGRLAEAEPLYRQILTVAPQHPDAMHLLGVIAHQLGQDEVAMQIILQAIALKPTAPMFYSNLGQVYRKVGRPDEAIAAFHQALQLSPDYADAYNNLGNVYNDRGQLHDAIAAFRRGLQIQPDCPEACVNLGGALADLGQLDEAIAAYREALRLRPDYADALDYLGDALLHQGCHKEAIEACRRAVQLNPNHSYAHSHLLFGLHYLPDLDAKEIFAEHLRWAAAHATPLAGGITQHRNDRDPGRRLRIGYVSPDFLEHPVAFFLDGLLGAHHLENVEIFCYANIRREDATTGRFRQLAGQWRMIAGRSDEQVAEQIRQDGIDILVDLSGHTGHHRLLVFARKPAPIQVSYLGYCDTTGMAVMDYRLTDAHADSPGATEHLHTEQLVRLPDSAWCYRPSEQSAPVSPPPVLRSGHITFGCFNARPKITDAVLGLWSRLLLSVPGSRLLLKNLGFREPSVQQRTRSLLADVGITPDRVELVGWAPTLAEHLNYYNQVDIALDTFSYHGTTTTCEALWMGVPVVTQAGRTHVSRVGVSLLTTVGLPELIAADDEDYLRIAVRLASDVNVLAALRSTLRSRLSASPLLDAPRFARHVEQAYRQMWRTWCEKQSVLQT